MSVLSLFHLYSIQILKYHSNIQILKYPDIEIFRYHQYPIPMAHLPKITSGAWSHHGLIKDYFMPIKLVLIKSWWMCDVISTLFMIIKKKSCKVKLKIHDRFKWPIFSMQVQSLFCGNIQGVPWKWYKSLRAKKIVVVL